MKEIKEDQSVQDNNVNINNGHVDVILYSEPHPNELDIAPTKDKGFLFKKLIPSIFQTKEYVLEDEADYSPWVVNRTLSFRLDCIHAANTLNIYGFLPKDMQYNYLLNKITPRKRFSKWVKKESIANLDAISHHFQVNETRAKEILGILSDSDIDLIADKYKKMEESPF